MAPLSQGLAAGASLGFGIRDRIDREQEREAVTEANEQSSDILNRLLEAEQAEQQDKINLSQLLQPLNSIVSRKRGPLRSGEIQVMSETLKAQGVEMSPLLKNVLEKEDPEVVTPIVRQIQQNIQNDPTAGLSKFSDLLQSNEQSALLLESASQAAAQQKLKGRTKPDPERRRLGEIEILKSKNRRLQQGMAALPNIGRGAEFARQQIQARITQNNDRINDLQKTRIVQNIGLGEDKPGQTGTFLVAEESGEKLRQLGTKQAVGKTQADLKGQETFQKEFAKDMVKTRREIFTLAKGAQKRNISLNAIEKLSKQFGKTGPTARLRAQTAKIMRDFNMNPAALGLPDNASVLETLASVSGQLAIGKLDQFTGAISEGERQFVVDITPNIEHTPQGIQLLVDFNRKLNQRAIDVAKFTGKWERENGSVIKENKQGQTFDEALTEFGEKNPLFSEQDKQRVQKLSGQDVPSDLPPGARVLGRLRSGELVIQTPDGKRHKVTD